jgi:hypothetical protein
MREQRAVVATSGCSELWRHGLKPRIVPILQRARLFAPRPERFALSCRWMLVAYGKEAGG